MPETTETDPQKVDPHHIASIVRSYVRHHTVGAGQISDLIKSVHGALAQLGKPNEPEEVLTPAVSVRQSVRQDFVVCLDCGYRAKMLRRHIITRHSLSPDEYFKRWGLRKDHPLTAPAYSEQRSAMAKEHGFGRKATAKPAPAATPATPASVHADPQSKAKPTQKRSTRSASKSDVVTEAAAAPTPVKKKKRSLLGLSKHSQIRP